LIVNKTTLRRLTMKANLPILLPVPQAPPVLDDE
jgi:hypothetical protein